MTSSTSLESAPASWRDKALGALRFALGEFGPLIAFWLVDAAFGLKPAIAASLAAIVALSLYKWRRGERFTRLYLLTSALTLVFGAIDLMSQTPFLLKYESVVTNIATGGAFVIGAFGEKPLVQEAAEQRSPAFRATPEIRRFFQLFTLVWALYFFLKAALYAWLALTLPLAEAMALRSVLGGASLALLIGVSVTQGRRLFFLCRTLGLLPRSDTEAAKS